jgi:hypothetical protein
MTHPCASEWLLSVGPLVKRLRRESLGDAVPAPATHAPHRAEFHRLGHSVSVRIARTTREPGVAKNAPGRN